MTAAQTMLILETFTIKGRGLVIVGYPAREVHRGERVMLPDGRAWTVAGVERFGGRPWRPEDGAGVLLAQGGAEPLPVKGETVTIGEVGDEPEIQHTIACDNADRELCDCADYSLPPESAR